MPYKVTWKKGMRLSTDVFNAMDASYENSIRLVSLISTGGRYGLFLTTRPFDLSVNINNNTLEVISLCCHGVTKSGNLIDIDFDSNFNTTFDTRINIPSSDNAELYYLVVRLHESEKREIDDMFSEQAYSFELLGENTIIGNDSLPVGCIINQYGWRLDEIGFVPPCLYVDAHPKYFEMLERAKNILKTISGQCLTSHDCVARHLLCSVWNTSSSEYISLDKKSGSITPGELLAAVQKVISSFVIGCSIDEYISLDNPDPFIAYTQIPYDARNMYHSIEKGLELCSEISVKMEAVCNMTEVTPKQTEKPKQKPQPSNENTQTVRKHWNGLEI